MSDQPQDPAAPPEEAARSFSELHVTTLLVASTRAMGNALDELGFAEDDDRVIEHDGGLAFLTCSHERDCDDLFALIAELSARGETWQLQSRIDTAPGRGVFHTLARHRPVEAIDMALEEGGAEEPDQTPSHDLDTAEGLQALRRALRKAEPSELFATIRSGADGRAVARVIRRGSGQVLAAASASDEAALRAAIRTVLPKVMFDVLMRPPS